MIVLIDDVKTHSLRSRTYDSSGKLVEYEDKDGIHNVLANEIYDSITTKNKSNNIAKHIKSITPQNVIETMESFRQEYGNGMIDIIEQSNNINNNLKQIFINHIKNCLNKEANYNKTFSNPNSQVKNKYHIGDNYSVSRNSGTLTIKNKSKQPNKISNIDLDDLVKDLPIEYQAKVKSYIQNLPGEVLEDLAIEISSKGIQYAPKALADRFAAASFDTKNNVIKVGNHFNKNFSQNFIHEMGHAVDWNGYIKNTSSSANDEDFNTIYQKELNKYLKKGFPSYEKNQNYLGRKNSDKEKSLTYAIKANYEMFAECYTLLMTGSCSSQYLIEDFFPETLKYVENKIKEIRNMSTYKRSGVF